jgi:Ca-activated chloride channel family protein
MKKLKNIVILLVSMLIVGMQPATAQKLAEVPNVMPLTRILFIFDGSYSMLGIWERNTKMDAAKSILIPFIDSVSKIPNVEIALRVYGNRSPFPPQDCNDSHLEVPFGKNNVPEIVNKILTLNPNGTTPIAYSIEQGAKDFPPDSSARNIIFLITDGVEACEGDPCAISRELQAKGVILKPFIIGVGTEVDFNKIFDCAGQVFSAKNELDFLPVLNLAMQRAMESTPLQVYLLDAYKKPNETDVPMTFYDNSTGFIHYNFVHSVIKPGEPDILFIDPLVSYKIKVHTMPPVYADNINLEPGKHTIVRIDAPQGYLVVERPYGFNISTPIETIVRQSGDMNTLNVQQVSEKVKYIAGKYDLEILTMPRTYFYDVEIKPDEVKTIKILQPGHVTFARPQLGVGAVYIDRNTDLEFVTYLPADSRKNDALTLQPGKYVVIWRDKFQTDTEKSVSKSFEIKPGGNVFISLQK